MKFGYPIVCQDSIRLALYEQPFIASAEDFVLANARLMVRTLFLTGFDTVIFDATAVRRRTRESWRGKNWEVFCQEFSATKEECILRADQSNRPDLIPVIERMALEWEPLGDDEPRYNETHEPFDRRYTSLFDQVHQQELEIAELKRALKGA
jgi:hypothetical protein